MSDLGRVRVLSIAHTAVSRAAGRLRYYPLAKRHDIDVHLVVPASWHQFGRTIFADPPDDPGITVHVLPIRLPRAGPMSWYLHFYSGLRRLVNKIGPHVIHLWEEPWSVVALQASRLKGKSALVMEVDQNILKRLPPPFEAIRKYVLRRTDYVLSRSPGATDVVRASGYRGPVGEIGYGVDQGTFQLRDDTLMNRSAHRDLRIGYVGRLIEEKGLDDALDAIARARSPMSLAIMGEGPYEKGLRERTSQLGLGERVIFQPWASSPAEVAQFMHTLDVLVLLTRSTKSVVEQFGRVIIEAQSCGVPVVGSQCGAIPNVIGDGGWIVPERDPDALAKVLDSIATDPVAHRARSLGALSNVATRFTYDAVAGDLVKGWMASIVERRNRS